MEILKDNYNKTTLSCEECGSVLYVNEDDYQEDNSGKFWARRSFKKNPGTITVKFMEPIEPGLPQDEFMDKLNSIFQTEISKLENK